MFYKKKKKIDHQLRVGWTLTWGSWVKKSSNWVTDLSCMCHKEVRYLNLFAPIWRIWVELDDKDKKASPILNSIEKYKKLEIVVLSWL